MFIGHFAVAFAAKRAAPRTSLGTLFAAAQLPDLAWPVFLLLGWERVAIAPGDTAFTPLRFESYPISHSLLTVCLWGAAFAALYRRRRPDPQGARWVGLLVVSHWLLDFVTHRPDLPLLPGLPLRAGLGLWNSVPAAVTVEVAMFAAGLWLYATATRPLDRIGRWAHAGLAGFLLVVYAGNLVGPPPPDVPAVALVTLSLWLLVWWAAWADRHRAVVSA